MLPPPISADRGNVEITNIKSGTIETYLFIQYLFTSTTAILTSDTDTRVSDAEKGCDSAPLDVGTIVGADLNKPIISQRNNKIFLQE